ncbi:MAG: DNA-3-methyladenine glycosylase 2 family protein [Gemmatimonadaceae bacterium]|nr:DNA-3-methyladenine glycosylase 2 family protein [Chitinophagaceae bacterium]
MTAQNFVSLCDQLCAKDKELKSIVDRFGHPPMWTRPANFESLIHIILEQQVSLASALAALNKLKEKIGIITPQSLLALSDEELRACYFSRQKTLYARHLASSILSQDLIIDALENMPDDQVRIQLKKIKGIGDWTADVFLMFALQRADIFPIGDLALVNAMRKVKNLQPAASKEQLLQIAESWRPHRSVASMILWHFYLSERKKSV